ncbi:uracil-DNA glycosylase [Phaeobacter sp. HF9A]|uniref:uracil-DNA glycosylase n=1 Tax=Phaeobacter sp. HF9A TaxID=2721561 RepID=UPI001430685D|nr:uracil-DNA glycosylase [Phaeobacter sp. HF9A]NIZ14074.1 uracil-DNA glycosylase [Phaeobacter sp. HF9A]
MADRVHRFVSRVSDLELQDVFNPYCDRCLSCDLPDGPLIRKKNLEASLRAAVELNVRTLWIARDLGYRGGRRTGLALTDEAHLQSFSASLGGVEVERSTFGPIVKERTASVIWQMVHRVSEPIFFWNAFPFHPHEAGKPMTNRCHTAKERRVTGWVLQELLDILSPQKIFAIGGDAKRCLGSLGIDATAFRHPSYGGQNQFIREVEEAYKLNSAKMNPQGAADKQLQLI